MLFRSVYAAGDLAGDGHSIGNAVSSGATAGVSIHRSLVAEDVEDAMSSARLASSDAVHGNG